MWFCKLCCVRLVWSLPVLCRYAYSNPWLLFGVVVVCMMSKSKLSSNGFCSVPSRSFRWCSLIYMASQPFMCLPFVHVLSNCMISSKSQNSCLFFNIFKALAKWGLLVRIYMIFPYNLFSSFLQFVLYMHDCLCCIQMCICQNCFHLFVSLMLVSCIYCWSSSMLF